MRSLRALAVYAFLTVALTWPFAANLHLMDAGDSAFFAWEIGWTVHALKTDPAQLPHANIFWPLRYTLGMDEPVLGTTLLVAPLAPFTDDAVLLYNVARLLTFLASALAAYWLAVELGAGEWIALLAGALFAFSPIRTDQLAHLSTLGSLLRQPFEEVWQSRAARFFRAKQMMPVSCAGCGEAAFCQGACVLYWREAGLGELGGSAADRPPLPPGFGRRNAGGEG